MEPKFLSFLLDADTPLYGGQKGVRIEPERSISCGDSANTKKIFLHNHSGTHIDFPNHFFENGKSLEMYPASFWFFQNVFILEKPVIENQIIGLSDNEINSIPGNVDLLIFKTGFGKYRGEEKYWKYNPGIGPDVALMLKKNFPYLRALGMDIISITSYQNREIGREAHREFLGGEKPILLIEDMNLSELSSIPSSIVCLPLPVKGCDGAPVTVVANFYK